MDRNQLEQLDDFSDRGHKRLQLEERIFQEVQEGDHHSSMAFYQAVSQELNNISDQAIDIIIRQKDKCDLEEQK